MTREIDPAVAFAFHQSKKVTRRRTKKGLTTQVNPSPVVRVKPPQRVWDTALEIAGGDARRLLVNPDGSVNVLNNRR